MSENSMLAFRCWSAEAVAQTVYSDIGQLAGDADALFLAAHTPMELKHRKGAELGAYDSGEAGVLAALTSRVGDLERNTLVAVTGGSGSGKSHVVRWVRAHLPTDDSRFQVLYVPRAVQTLRELLRKIIEGLPGVEGAELMSRVDSAISGVKPGELQARLVSEMKIALNWTIDDRSSYDGETSDDAAAREDRNSMLGVRDEDGGRRDGLADLLDLSAFRESLLRPEGRLGQLVKSYFTETSRRDDNDEIFTAEDLPLRARGILSELRGHNDLLELWHIITRNPKDAIALLEEALRAALPRAVGLRGAGGDTLDSLFRESREALRAQGQELFLIFEDLAQFGLVDGELYDQFVTPPGDELAPLRVIFAVTDGPYQRMERTVRTRIEHEFRVGDSALADPFQFVSRYLNLVRVGRQQTQQLWASHVAERTTSSWMLNACDSREEGLPCRFRETCHAAFGAVPVEGLGDVGLYPYNEEAFGRALSRIGASTTPRGVLDECVLTILPEADIHIGRKDYPHERTREQFDFKVRMAKDALLEANPSSDPERTYRALVIWGNEESLPVDVMQAFALDGTAGRPAVRQSPVSSFAGRQRSTGAPKVQEEGGLENPLLPLFQWQNGDELPEGETNLLRTTMYGLTFDRLQLDQSCVHIYSGRGNAIMDNLFNATSFAIEGTRGRQAGAQSVRFTLRRNADDTRVLAAVRWFRDHGHFDPAQAKWQWPEGYDPGQLIVDLESRLDDWATEVRARFLDLTGGSLLAQQAIGMRAIALAASGRDAALLNTTSSVLAAPTETAFAPSPAWASVDDVASEIIRALPVSDYVGEFAAVRQSDRGAPQLVDPRELDHAISNFLANPAVSLAETVDSKADPVLAQGARHLLDALTSAAAAEAESAATAAEAVAALLEGKSPASVGAAAFAVGDSAKDAGFFRPHDQWSKFRSHVDFVAASSVVALPDFRGGDIGAVLRGQRTTRQITLLAHALTVIREAMELTLKECERSGGVGGDVSALKSTVKAQVQELAGLVESLAARSNS